MADSLHSLCIGKNWNRRMISRREVFNQMNEKEDSLYVYAGHGECQSVYDFW